MLVVKNHSFELLVWGEEVRVPTIVGMSQEYVPRPCAMCCELTRLEIYLPCLSPAMISESQGSPLSSRPCARY